MLKIALKGFTNSLGTLPWLKYKDCQDFFGFEKVVRLLLSNASWEMADDGLDMLNADWPVAFRR